MNRKPVMSRFHLLQGLLIVLALGILSLAGCGKQAGTAEGTVRDSASQEAVSQAQVVVFGLESLEGAGDLDVYSKGALLQKQFTDENGAFSFSLEPGRYVIQVWVEGLEVGDRMVQVKPGQATPVDFSIEIPPQ
jgi:hypothetical protein